MIPTTFPKVKVGKLKARGNGPRKLKNGAGSAASEKDPLDCVVSPHPGPRQIPVAQKFSPAETVSQPDL